MYQYLTNEEELNRINKMLSDILHGYYINPETEPVLDFHTKTDLMEEFGEELPPSEGQGLEATLEEFRRNILPKSVKTWHPLFMNQMFGGASFASVVGDMMANMMNPTLATWEMSPVATIIERNVCSWMAQMLGMKAGSSGILLPGGSLANLLALTIARNERLDQDVIHSGMRNCRAGAILCSEASHYSIKNAASMLGIGLNQLIQVKTNERDEMLPDDLRLKLRECDEQGLVPIAIVVTIGITVTGGCDPLSEVLEICRGRDIHIHVDAAFGGTVALTSRAPACLEGIDQVDSVIWDAHKWLHAPLTCTGLLVPNPQILKKNFNSKADYLFHPQQEEFPLTDDLGQYTVLCGKRFDALKLWLLFKSFGTDYITRAAESRIQLTDSIYQVLVDDPDFEPSYQPVLPIVCFRFLPAQMRQAPPEYVDRLHRWIREETKRRNLALFNISKLKGRDHFRAVVINPLTNIGHVTGLFEQIKALGWEFLRQNPV